LTWSFSAKAAGSNAARAFAGSQRYGLPGIDQRIQEIQEEGETVVIIGRGDTFGAWVRARSGTDYPVISAKQPN
jgi:hypothetical protein